MSGSPVPDEPAILADLRAEIEAAGRRVTRRIDPGVRGLVISVAVFLLLVTALLPGGKGITGWQVLFAVLSASVPAGMIPAIFAVTAMVCGVLITTLGLTTRLWVMAWISAIGCGFSTVIGVLAIWSLQSSASHQPGPGPGVGLILAALVLLTLTVTWLKLAFSRQ